MALLNELLHEHLKQIQGELAKDSWGLLEEGLGNRSTSVKPLLHCQNLLLTIAELVAAKVAVSMTSQAGTDHLSG